MSFALRNTFFLPEFYFFSLLSFPRIPELSLAPGRPGPADPSEELARQDGQWQSRTFGADRAARELDEAVPQQEHTGPQEPWVGPTLQPRSTPGYYRGDTDLMP